MCPFIAFTTYVTPEQFVKVDPMKIVGKIE